MLVYGDPVRVAAPRAMLARIAEAWREAAAMPAGIARHSRLATALIEAGELAQALADLAFEARGRIDDLYPGDAARMRLCLSLARALQASWDSGFALCTEPDEAAIEACREGTLPASVRVKVPEGYAFYALYPEAVIAAARTLSGGGAVRVIGIRSIGTGLAALAAAALGDPAPVTLRPTGHPFRREVRLSERMAAHLLEGVTGAVVVDEGPGLSGSSFGAVADALEAVGMPRERIAFLPSHSGDLGGEASEAHRTRWAAARRPVVDMDALILTADDPAHRLETWAAELAGPPLAPLEDISGGAWRARVLGPDESGWPASLAYQERRKFLMRTEQGLVLIKFMGLGPEGERKAGRAAALSEAGFIPPVLGLRHGFLVQRWLDGVRPLASETTDRAALVGHLARYLAFRARRFPAPAEAGASGETLVEMTRRNTSLALGEAAGDAATRAAAALPALDAGLRRIETDGRMQAHEWLVGPGGRLWKADAVDHHAAHDLVGCQDLAWDVTGAIVELGLTPTEGEALCAAIEADGDLAVSLDRLRALRPAYLAFHLGRARMGAEALAGWPEEARRLAREAERYEHALRALLAGNAP
ncbi:hypothetical protein [Salinarimonas soli]|uniref:hypothetical protein n=1 Tax=Salinarimonas soli TaxID=1638099 RepID=UPI001661C5FD|nr:hypothetical protein [Salinarimonas soli]